MRAAVVRWLGEATQLGELPDAERGSGEALIEVRAAALNPIDIAIAAGRFHAGFGAQRVVAAGRDAEALGRRAELSGDIASSLAGTRT